MVSQRAVRPSLLVQEGEERSVGGRVRGRREERRTKRSARDWGEFVTEQDLLLIAPRDERK